MSSHSPHKAPSSRFKAICLSFLYEHISDDPSSATHVALRTYALALALSLGPSLLPFLSALLSPAKRSHRTDLQGLQRVLRRELSPDGFPFSITVVVGGGAALQSIWKASEAKKRKQEKHDRLHTTLQWTPSLKSFVANLMSSAIGFALLQAGNRRLRRLGNTQQHFTSSPVTEGGPSAPRTSPTLDLTLMLFVRAVDSIVQSFVHSTSTQNSLPPSENLAISGPVSAAEATVKSDKRDLARRKLLTTRIDALVFWACSARIMWCFFYQSERLPRTYVKWITTLAKVDNRILDALRDIRLNKWSYVKGYSVDPQSMANFTEGLGYPGIWGNPSALPAYGGPSANNVWKTLGVTNRNAVGGLPCELVHGGTGAKWGLDHSCTANAGIRGMQALFSAIVLYVPVHVIPVLLTRPHTMLRLKSALLVLLGALRSATFLSTFVTSIWYTICLTRTLVLARLLPFISHDFWDGPYGCVMAGCLTCGSSIWIENGRRRGEMALYVLPRAVRACLPDKWVKNGNRGFRLTESIAFIVSLSWLLTAATHRPETLRGLSRWTLAFITRGPLSRSRSSNEQKSDAPGTSDTLIVP